MALRFTSGIAGVPELTSAEAFVEFEKNVSTVKVDTLGTRQVSRPVARWASSRYQRPAKPFSCGKSEMKGSFMVKRPTD